MGFEIQRKLFLKRKISRHQFNKPIPVEMEEVEPVNRRNVRLCGIVGLCSRYETDPGDEIAAWPQHTLYLAECHIERDDVIQRRGGDDQVELVVFPGQELCKALNELEFALELACERIDPGKPVNDEAIEIAWKLLYPTADVEHAAMRIERQEFAEGCRASVSLHA